MAYIDFGAKYWRRRLTKKERRAVRAAFIAASSYTEAEWERLDYEALDEVRYFNRFPRPESDKWDNYNGVTAKQIRRYLDRHGAEGLVDVLRFLKRPDCCLDEDGFVDWKRVWYRYVEEPEVGGKKAMRRLLKGVGASRRLRRHLVSPEYAARLVRGDLETEALEKRLKKWRRRHGRVPTLDVVWVTLDPDAFGLADFMRFRAWVERNRGCAFEALDFETMESHCLVYEALGDRAARVIEKHGLPAALAVATSNVVDERVLDALSGIDRRDAAAQTLLDPRRLKRLGLFERNHKRFGDRTARALARASYEAIAVVDRGLRRYEEAGRKPEIDEEALDALTANALRWMRSGDFFRVLETYGSLREVATGGPLQGFARSLPEGWRVYASKLDADTLFLGEMTDCCLHCGHSNGLLVFENALPREDVTNLIFRDARDRIAVHILVWEHKLADRTRALVLDSVETHRQMTGDSALEKALAETVRALYGLGRYDVLYLGDDGQHSPDRILAFGDRVPEGSERFTELVGASAKVGYSDLKDGVLELYREPPRFEE